MSYIAPENHRGRMGRACCIQLQQAPGRFGRTQLVYLLGTKAKVYRIIPQSMHELLVKKQVFLYLYNTKQALFNNNHVLSVARGGVGPPPSVFLVLLHPLTL